MAARRFLWIIAILIILVIAGAFAYRLFGTQLLRVATVPTVSFAESERAPDPIYGSPIGWLAHPALPNDPARWAPEGYQDAPRPQAALFYVTPTAYLSRDRWNAPFDDGPTNQRLALFLRSQASVFNSVAEIWSPRYRQATFGAFLTDEADARRALDFAYADVLRAFDVFVAAQPAGRPLILAGHSQGSLHLLRLLRDRVVGRPLAGRVVATYVAGWPVSITADLPALGLSACERREQAGCLLSWQSFAEPANPDLILEVYDRTDGYAGTPRRGTPMVCTNPLLGAPGMADAQANLGALVPNADMSSATLAAHGIGARCDGRGSC